jgi:hypothetical protein
MARTTQPVLPLALDTNTLDFNGLASADAAILTAAKAWRQAASAVIRRMSGATRTVYIKLNDIQVQHVWTRLTSRTSMEWDVDSTARSTASMAE